MTTPTLFRRSFGQVLDLSPIPTLPLAVFCNRHRLSTPRSRRQLFPPFKPWIDPTVPSHWSNAAYRHSDSRAPRPSPLTARRDWSPVIPIPYLFDPTIPLRPSILACLLYFAAGRRPRCDPHWRDLVLFHEYFHGETGQALGASHQTGWTALAIGCLRRSLPRRSLQS